MLTILEVQETELIRLRATFSPLAKRRLDAMESLKTVSNSSTYPKEQVHAIQLFSHAVACTLCFPRRLFADETVLVGTTDTESGSYTLLAHSCCEPMHPLRTHACL